MADNFSIYAQYRKNTIKEKHRIPVTYLCWGCGSSMSRYEATDLPIAVKELRNLCSRCVALAKRGNKGNNQSK